MKNFYTIRKAAFALMLALALPAAMQAQSESNILFYESFNGLNGQGGNDGYFDNDADAGVEVGAEDLLTAEALDNKEGWGDFVKVAICNQCVRIATKKNNGEITTPAFAVNGSAQLTFNAAAQLEDVVTLYVEVVGEGTLTYAEQTGKQVAIALPTSVAGETSLANQTYALTIKDATGNISLKFSTISNTDSKQRAYLDEIKVNQLTPDGIASVNTERKANQIYDLMGRKVTRPTKGLYIVNGKKMMR